MEKKACIMCGCMLEGREEFLRLICFRCKPLTPEEKKKRELDGERPAAPPEDLPEPSAEPKKVLIVDDEPVLLKLLKSRVQSAGYEVLTASDGEEGYGKIKSASPDLVLTDVLMPNLTGYDLLKRLQKEKDGTQHIPVLVMTAKKDMKDFFQSWEIHGFIVKPIAPDELLQKISYLIDVAEKLKRVR